MMMKFQTPRSRLSAALLLLASGAVLTVPAAAQPRAERQQERVRDAAAEGRVMPLNGIVASVQGQEPFRSMNYLGGPVFDEDSMTYQLKFLDGKRLVVVIVDARSGRIVGRR